MEYGYARVSSKEQNEERQLIALRAAGLHKHQIFLDKQPGRILTATSISGCCEG